MLKNSIMLKSGIQKGGHCRRVWVGPIACRQLAQVFFRNKAEQDIVLSTGVSGFLYERLHRGNQAINGVGTGTAIRHLTCDAFRALNQ
jgi:hypothetical protein